jgi:hypothetical protein
MERPDGPKPVKLLRTRLDDAGLDAHLAALAGQAQAIELRVKGAAGSHSDAATDTLDVVGARLRAGEVVAIQIRFFQDDAWWIDTVMRAKDGYRLVRMREEEPPDP